MKTYGELMEMLEEPVNQTDSVPLMRELSVDCVIFGLSDKKLKVLTIRHSTGDSLGQWALPGGYIRYDEALEDAASRVLYQLTGVKNIYLEQIHTFSDAKRVPKERTVTTAFFALVQPEYHEVEDIAADEVRWCSLDEIPELIYDHNDILRYGVKHLRWKIQFEPIGVNLLPPKFTLGQLQDLYEAILDQKLDKPNFRRKILRMNFLIKCNETQKKVPHRAGTLYRFDEEEYQKLCEDGFTFKF